MGLSLFRAFLVINVFSIGTENPITPKPYRFSVYPVNKCPGSKTEFQRASQRMNCTKDLRYLCAPNKYLSSLIEFCTDRKRSLYGKGNCVVLEGEGDLDHYRCVEKFNRSCPSTPYYDEEIYKYPACLEIDKDLRCFIAENGCNKREFLTTETHLNISKMETVGNETNLNISNMEIFGNETSRGASHGLLAIGYIIAIAVVLTVILLIWIIFQKRKKEQVEKSKDNYENESLLKDNPEIDDDKLRQFLSKGEITVCHVRCIIVGCAKAGKTTLLKRFQNVSFDELMQIERTEMVDFHVNSFEVLLEEETIQSIEKEDTVPTILFSKENLEMPFKENDGKMAEEAHQPTIRKKNVSEKSSLKNTTLGQIENIPMDKLNNQANNDNAEDEENLIFKPHSQDTTLVQNQIFPEPNEEHAEDIDAIVHQNDFEQYAILKIKDAVNELLNETDLRPRITFLDFAGQSMYYAFHQIFLRPKSCSILVVDMTKGLDEEVGVQDENEKECSQFASWKYKDYYKFWLRSIDVFSDTESPVIIVGTHQDQLSNKDCRNFRKNLLQFLNSWCHSDFRKHINADRMYTIGFPDSGPELEDLKKLKNCIANIVKSRRFPEKNIRPVWALFEHILNKMKETKKVITRKTLSDFIYQLTAQELRIDESEISEMLDFFHGVGVLLYFDKDGLKENIILDIQWLLDAFKCIIEYPVRTEENDMERSDFYHTGTLDNVELDRIWDDEGKDFLKHRTTIIAYMQQLGLLVPLKELHPTDSSWYYFPSMNSKRFDKTGENNTKSSILCFKFDDEMQLPINVFHGIVLKCSKLNNWSILTEGAKKNICLYQNAACFSFQKHVVVLCNCNFEIRVQVWALPEIYDGRLLKEIKHSVKVIINDDDRLSCKIGYKCRKDVLNVEEDVSFISHTTVPVPGYLCETCDVDKKHEVDNDICWDPEVNGKNQERIDMLEKTKVPSHVIGKWNRQISAWKDDDKMFLETHNFTAMLQKVRDQPYVTFVGAPGSGKTATARHIAIILQREGYQCLPITESSKIEEYCDPENKQVFVIDDVGGFLGFDLNSFFTLTRYKENIINPSMPKTKVLMTCREVVYRNKQASNSFLTKEEHVVLLQSTENALNENDKRELLSRYQLGKYICNVELGSTSPMFPLLCKLFSTKDKFKGYGPPFFTSPVPYILKALDGMKVTNNVHYASLVLLMAWQGPLSIDSLEDSKSSEKKFEEKKCEFLKACKVSSLTENFIFVDALSEMEGTYTVKNDKQINFIHESMFKIIAYHFGRHFPEVILENLNNDYIANYIQIDTSNSRKRKRDSEEETDQTVEVTEQKSVNDLCIKLKESQCPMLAKHWFITIFARDLFAAFGNVSLKHPYVFQPFIRRIEDQRYDVFHFLFLESFENDNFVYITVLGSLAKNLKPNHARALLTGSMRINKGVLFGVKAISFVIYYGHHQILQCIIDRVIREKGNLDDLFENEYTEGFEMDDNDEDCEDPDSNTNVTDRDCDTDSNSETTFYLKQFSMEQIRLLCLGCYSGDLTTVQILLRHVDINALNIKDNTYKENNPLAIAIKLGHLKIAMELLKIKADVDSNIFEYSPLIGACKYGHISIVEELIKNKTDVNLKCKSLKGGCITPLIMACQRGQLRVVEELIKSGADVNLAGKETPLTAACLNGNLDIVEILLAAKADINLGNEEKKTPLEIARERGHLDVINRLTEVH